MWKIKKTISKGDYNYALVPEHPNSTKNGYVLYHRIVMENSFDRLLTHKEIVHHINDNKKDNRIENLEVLSNREHASLHRRKIGRKFVKLKCPYCKKIFEREHNKTHLCNSMEKTFCSRKCNGKFSREVQLLRRTSKEIEQAITENIVKEYRKYS